MKILLKNYKVTVCLFGRLELCEIIWESEFCRLNTFILWDLKRYERADLGDG